MKFLKRGKLLITVGVAVITAAVLMFLFVPPQPDLSVSFVRYEGSQDRVRIRLANSGERELACFLDQTMWGFGGLDPPVRHFSHGPDRLILDAGATCEVALRYNAATNGPPPSLEVIHCLVPSTLRVNSEHILRRLVRYDVSRWRRRSVIVELPPFSESINHQ